MRATLVLLLSLASELAVFFMQPMQARAMPTGRLLSVIPGRQTALGVDLAQSAEAARPALQVVAFREAVAAQYRLDSSQVRVTPADAESSGMAIARIGDLSPYVARSAGHEIRGWVDDQGAVVLPENVKLGRLLRVVALRSATPALSPLGVAERLAWMLGPALRLVRSPLDLPPSSRAMYMAPQRSSGLSGVVTLRFLLKQAAGPGQVQLYEVTLRCHADYQTSLQIQRV